MHSSYFQEKKFWHLFKWETAELQFTHAGHLVTLLPPYTHLLPAVGYEGEEEQRGDHEDQENQHHNGYHTQEDVSGILEAHHFAIVEPVLKGEGEGGGQNDGKIADQQHVIMKIPCIKQISNFTAAYNICR